MKTALKNLLIISLVIHHTFAKNRRYCSLNIRTPFPFFSSLLIFDFLGPAFEYELKFKIKLISSLSSFSVFEFT